MTKNHYRVSARKMTTRNLLTVAQHDGARMPSGNPQFIPDMSRDKDQNMLRRERAARDAITSVPFTIVANERMYGVDVHGRPYIPATSFRGCLRNLSTMIMISGMSDLSHSLVGAMAVGGKIENGKSRAAEKAKLVSAGMSDEDAKNAVNDKGPKSLEDFRRRDFGIPHFALFGLNNPSFLKGFDSFSILLSEDHFVLTRSGIVRQPYSNQNPQLVDVLSVDGWNGMTEDARNDSEGVARKNEANAVLKEATAEVKRLKKEGASQAEIEAAEAIEAEERNNAQTADKDRTVAAGQLHGKWCIPTGVNFNFSLTHRMADEELGLLIHVLSEFGKSPMLGGDKGRGAGGNFDFDMVVERYDDSARRYTEVGNITNDGWSETLNIYTLAFAAKLPEYQEALRKLKT